MEETKNTAEEIVTEEPKAPKATDAKADKKKVKKLEAEIAELQKQVEEKDAAMKECEDKYLRMMAEYDNFRKRSAKEKEGVWADAYADCVFPVP